MTATTTQADQHTPRTLAVVGRGEAAAPPDTVVVHLEVSATAGSVTKALETTSRYVSQIGAAMRDIGLADVDIASEGASVGPAWNERGPLPGQHRSSHRLRLRLRSQHQLGHVLSACAHLAGNDLAVNDIGLQIADPAPLRATARERAFADARTIAEQLAELAGATLGRVLAVTEGSAVNPAAPVRMFAEAASARDLGAVESGQNTETVVLNVVFELL